MLPKGRTIDTTVTLRKQSGRRRHEANLDKERGRELKTGISGKCANRRHVDCAAMRCQCPCHAEGAE